jgi:hypothetical protein
MSYTLYQVTTSFGACAGVEVENGSGLITGTAPIFGRFVGQPWTNLQTWSKVLQVDSVATYDIPLPWGKTQKARWLNA